MLCYVASGRTLSRLPAGTSLLISGMPMLRFQNHMTGTEACAQAWGDAHQPLLPVRLAHRLLTLLLHAQIIWYVDPANASPMPAWLVLLTPICAAMMQGLCWWQGIMWRALALPATTSLIQSMPELSLILLNI